MAKVRSPFPDPVCVLPDEYGLVAAVLAAPLDDLPKLVYADWLEERDDPRGAFMRKWLAARKAGQPRPKPYKGLSKCWMSVVGFTLDEWLVKQGNPAWGDAVRATAAPCLVVRTIPLKDGETVPTGNSKMGGLPDLDPETEWPTGEDGDSETAFVAQWNLAELAVSPCAAKLPKEGLLSFFIDLQPYLDDWASEGKSKVLFTPVLAATEEREPNALSEDNDLPPCRVEFREWLSIPFFSSTALKRLLPEIIRRDYAVPYFAYPMPRGTHHVLGHARPIQWYPVPHGTRKEWSRLTQFGPDECLRLEACDGGTWYFMTPTADLAKGKFGNTQMEFQTG
jgi:uncharacterized protein (TIGR02996 family)